MYTGHPQRNRARLPGVALPRGEWSAAVGRAPRVDPSVVTMSQHSYGMYGGGGGGASRRRAPGINVRQVRQLTLWGRDGLAWTVVCVGGMSRDTRRHCLVLPCSLFPSVLAHVWPSFRRIGVDEQPSRRECPANDRWWEGKGIPRGSPAQWTVTARVCH